ncbi:hypothetical protein DUZ99_12740 [Xylanibacillus composti]|uniref:WYL domain-containing protein n=1 Tax=Xylanibacillus composti TaxID=1572762 RepID=A0A8J4H484_9BACL|nr:hypothetical protein [Xylanibacillus composti]MDT9725839.1 hypothetical protein [Xylanibacillus composti]GIQ69207.1 hypothetical protein XYCOK13_20310 [Xylanibacillus composti]
MGLKLGKYVGQTIEIIYIDRLQRISQRLITVRRVDDGIIRAFCHKQQGPRVFRVEQILAAAPATGRRIG